MTSSLLVALSPRGARWGESMDGVPKGAIRDRDGPNWAWVGFLCLRGCVVPSLAVSGINSPRLRVCLRHSPCTRQLQCPPQSSIMRRPSGISTFTGPCLPNAAPGMPRAAGSMSGSASSPVRLLSSLVRRRSLIPSDYSTLSTSVCPVPPTPRAPLTHAPSATEPALLAVPRASVVHPHTPHHPHVFGWSTSASYLPCCTT